MNHKSTQLAVYEVPYKGGPAASVRYTTYAEDGKPLAVEQINYPADALGLVTFDNEATAALEMGIDVSIITRVDVEMFPELSKYTTL
tara:strand:- start:240 stop:500 length:261 start_codon:yes stop_codon:yes gene_type:complete